MRAGQGEMHERITGVGGRGGDGIIPCILTRFETVWLGRAGNAACTTSSSEHLQVPPGIFRYRQGGISSGGRRADFPATGLEGDNYHRQSQASCRGGHGHVHTGLLASGGYEGLLQGMTNFAVVVSVPIYSLYSLLLLIDFNFQWPLGHKAV